MLDVVENGRRREMVMAIDEEADRLLDGNVIE